jgi:hypothetical protein
LTSKTPHTHTHTHTPHTRQTRSGSRTFGIPKRVLLPSIVSASRCRTSQVTSLRPINNLSTTTTSNLQITISIRKLCRHPENITLQPCSSSVKVAVAALPPRRLTSRTSEAVELVTSVESTKFGESPAITIDSSGVLVHLADRFLPYSCLVVERDENRCKRCQDRNLACTYSASAPVDPRAIKRKRQESSYSYSYNQSNPLQVGTVNNINIKPLDPRLLGSTSVSACILSSIMRYSHVTHIEQGLAKMDEKYSLVRRPFLGDRDYRGLRYVLVARNPDRVGLDVPAGEGQGGQRRRRKRRRKVQVGEVLMDVKAFSLDGDYERLGGRYGVAGLRDRRKCRL